MSVDDQKSKELFNKRADIHGNYHSVLDAGISNEAQHSNILHDYFSKKYILKKSRLKSTDVVLDFGCGVGRISNFIRTSVSKVIGYDTSDSMLDIAKKSSPINSIYLDDLDEISSNEIDVVIAHWVLAHISDEGILEAFSKIASKITDKGRICIFEQTPTDEKHFLSNGVYNRRTIGQYESLFKSIGFHLVTQKHVYRTPSYARSIWNKMSSSAKWLLPFLYFIEKKTLFYKVENVEYYTTFMEFTKEKS